MELEPNEDQKQLLDSVDAMLARHYQPGFRAAGVESETGWSAAVWQASTDLGLTTLTIDEEHNGAGAGPAEVYVVQEALGRHAAVEPLLDGLYLPSWLISDLGSDEQRRELLPALADGTAIGAIAHAEPGQEWDAPPSVTADHTGGQALLSGVKSPVARADQATFFLVTARDADGELAVYLVAADAAGLSRDDGRTTDWTHASRVSFDRTPATPLGQPGLSTAHALDIAFARARIALLGEAVGLMESGLTQTVAYLKSRKQFGVPLSTFQALVHRAADLYAQVELARSMALWATATLEVFEADHTVALPEVADDGFVFVAEIARTVAEEVVQLHGGIGMTFETAISHYAARLTAITQSFGGITATRRRALNSASPVTPPSALRNNADQALLPA